MSEAYKSFESGYLTKLLVAIRMAKSKSELLNMLIRDGKVKLWIVMLALLVGHAFAGELEDFKSAVQRKDYVTAAKLLSPNAEQGRPQAQAYLAFFYYFGKGVPRDYGAAVKWAQKAADQDEPMGNVLLGMSYLNGQGVSQDNERALLLLQKTAAQNNPLARYELGKMMLVGRAIARDEYGGELHLNYSAQSLEEFQSNVNLMIEKKTELVEWRKGSTRLLCGISCAFTFGANRVLLKEDYALG